MPRGLLYLGLAMVCLVCVPQFARAQSESNPIHVEWTVGDPLEMGWTVGDRIPLRLRVTYPSDLEVTLPALPNNWGPFEVLEQMLLEPVKNEDGTLMCVREATVTLWSPGEYETPPISIRYRDGAGQLHEVPAPPLSITLNSVLEEGETEKRDLKPQVSLPRPPMWPWLLGGFLLVLLVGVGGRSLLARLRRQPASQRTPALVIDPRPPHEIAYSELDRIAALRLPVMGELEQHYTLVADCLRIYIQGRYHIPALDQTTEELLVAFRRARLDRNHASLVGQVLAEADLVKFARFVPASQQAYAAIAQARHIVDVTKPAEEVEIQKLDRLSAPEL